MTKYYYCMVGILYRETLRFIHLKSRLLSALVRPLIWLFIFAAGFRSVLGVSIIPPYETYVLYEVYITPGLMGMIQLFSGMQHSLSMIFDREIGSMKIMLVSPMPRWYLLLCKQIAGAFISVIQVYAFLCIAWFWEIQMTWQGYLLTLPIVFLTGLCLNCFGLLISSVIKQLENFAGVMNFVIFPLFFTSSALYPLWKLQESSIPLYYVATFNPFTHIVELLRFSLYEHLNMEALWVTLGVLCGSFIISVIAYDPSRGMMQRKIRE